MNRKLRGKIMFIKEENEKLNIKLQKFEKIIPDAIENIEKMNEETYNKFLYFINNMPNNKWVQKLKKKNYDILRAGLMSVVEKYYYANTSIEDRISEPDTPRKPEYRLGDSWFPEIDDYDNFQEAFSSDGDFNEDDFSEY